jgi:hypothetical protein
MEYFIAYVLNIAAAFTVIALLILAGSLLVRQKRKRLIAFFGISKSKRLRAYISHLRIALGGAFGADGLPRSMSGSAVPVGELQLVSIYGRLFNYSIPALQEQPGFWRHVLLTDVQLEVSPAPLQDSEIEKGCSILCFGSPGYNVASKWIEDTLNPVARFIPSGLAIEVDGVAPFTDALTGFAQRIRIGDGAAAAFYVAGMSEAATMAAAYYLASEWEQLDATFGTRKNFCVVLKAEPLDYRNYTVVLERRESEVPAR